MSISGLEQVHKMNLIEIIKKRRSHRDEFKKLGSFSLRKGETSGLRTEIPWPLR